MLGNIGNIFTTILVQPLANGLVLFYDIFFHNMGLAIIFFTVFLRFILNPLTKPYLESMKKMRDLAPQLDKIKQKYKGDKVKLAQAQSDLYKQKGVNPSAGCVPYLIQIVILIAFFNMFNRVLTPNGDPMASFNTLLYEPLKFAPGETINTQFLYLDVTKPDHMPFDLGFLPFAIPGFFLIFAAVTQFLSSKMMAPEAKKEKKVAKKTKQQSDDIQVAMQQSMIYTFPLFTLFFGMRFASGLVLYWMVFSLFQLIQQYRMYGWGGLKPMMERYGVIKK
jgi:YidC/Oxa1 family membrane protein insertase